MSESEQYQSIIGLNGADNCDNEGTDLYLAEKPEIILQDIELWRKFKTLTNEMIVTKAGR